MKAVKWFEWPIGIGLALLSISHWFPLGVTALELLGAFAHFTVIFSLFVMAVSMILKWRVVASFALLSAMISGFLIGPYFVPFDTADEADFVIGQFNLYHHNPTPEVALQHIAELDPDIFTVQELNADWTGLTDSIFSESHPYVLEAPLETCCYGIGIYSKYPFSSYKVLDLESTPVIIVQVVIGFEEFTLVSLHTRPPVFPDETDARNRQLDAVADIVLNEPTNCLVVGDLNIVPWDRTFKKFLETGELTAVRNGFQPTYPMELGFPLIPIDHIAYSGYLKPTSCETVTLPGSDHRGLVAGFTFKD